MSDKAAGPISIDELKALADAPHGKAVETLRKHDPLFGREPGEKLNWYVELRREVEQTGSITVKASSEQEAKELAMERLNQVDWDDCYHSEPDVEGAYPR